MKRLLLLILCCLIMIPLTAQTDLDNYIQDLDGDQAAALRNGELIKRDSEFDHSLGLVPAVSLADSFVDPSVIEDDTFFVECLSLVPYPETVDPDDEDMMLYLYNTIRSLSTQEGITYISHRKGNKPAKLITTSYVAPEINKRKRLPDPVVTEVPEADTLIVFQNDTSFGKNFYQYDYYTDENEILVTMQNKTVMRVFGIFHAAKKEMINITFQVMPTDEGILLYSMVYAPGLHYEINILGIKVHLPSAFRRRLVAVQEWFIDQL